MQFDLLRGVLDGPEQVAPADVPQGYGPLTLLAGTERFSHGIGDDHERRADAGDSLESHDAFGISRVIAPDVQVGGERTDRPRSVHDAEFRRCMKRNRYGRRDDRDRAIGDRDFRQEQRIRTVSVLDPYGERLRIAEISKPKVHHAGKGREAPVGGQLTIVHGQEKGQAGADDLGGIPEVQQGGTIIGRVVYRTEVGLDVEDGSDAPDMERPGITLTPIVSRHDRL